MKNEKEKETSIKTNHKIKTPNKIIYNTEGNKNFEKFKPYYSNKLLNYNSINKKLAKLNQFSNNKITFSVDKRNGILPILNNDQQYLNKRKKERSNIGFQNMGNIYENLNLCNPTERDNLILQLYHTQNDINKANKEIKDLKVMFEIIEKENLSNKYMISQLLNKNKETKIEINDNSNNIKIENNTENNNTNNNENNENNNNNNIENNDNKTISSNNNENEKKSKSVNKNNEKLNLCLTIKRNKDNNNLFKNEKTNAYSTIKKDRNIMLDIEQSKINVLKKELTYYKKCLNTKEEELAKFKKTNKIKQYTEINELIEKKNKSLEELIKNSNDIQTKIHKTDEIIINLSLNIYNIKECSTKKKSKNFKL